MSVARGFIGFDQHRENRVSKRGEMEKMERGWREIEEK
jgi:hypothetical protein